jgi:hypothetical protein
MSMLIAMFCEIDDFCKGFEPLYTPRLLQSGQRQRTRQTGLTLSELMTIRSSSISIAATTATSTITTRRTWPHTYDPISRPW